MAESALIQNVEGPVSGNRTTAALSPIELPPCNVVVFYSYEVKKRKCYNFMAAITGRAKAHTAAPIWATSYLKKRQENQGLNEIFLTFFIFSCHLNSKTFKCREILHF